MDNELLKDTVLKLKDRIIKTEAGNIQLSETDTRQGLINPLFRALRNATNIDGGPAESWLYPIGAVSQGAIAGERDRLGDVAERNESVSCTRRTTT